MVKWNRHWKKEPEQARTDSLLIFLDGKSAESKKLEIGCGDLGKIEVKLNDNYHGLDISLVALKAAKRKHPAATLINADAAHLPFKDNAFQSVCAFSVMEFLGQDFPATFREIVRVTGNEMHFSTMHVDAMYKPEKDDGKNYVKFSYGTMATYTGLIGNTPEQLLAVLRDVGIEVSFSIVDETTGNIAEINPIEYLNGLDDESKKQIIIKAKKTID